MPIHKLAATAALSLALAAPLASSFAQNAPPPMMHGPHGGGRMNRMGEALGLTDAQKSQMMPILQNARQQGMAIRSDASLTPEARQAKMRDLQKSTRSQMMAVLTPAQRAKMKATRMERREMRKGA